MVIRPLMLELLVAGGALALIAGPSLGADAGQIVSGRRLAQEHCGECHALAGGRSPFPDAPPFRRLYRRYRAGGLDALLDEGMLAHPPIEEEGERFHPRMPSIALDDGERADLRAYLLSLEPRQQVGRPRP